MHSKSTTAKSPIPKDDELCPLGPEGCPVYDQMLVLRTAHQRLADLSQTDPLTGMYNFRYLRTALEREMERTSRTGAPTSLIMVDLDHFKKINDTYGHHVGNKVLRWTAAQWTGRIRKIDLACRYGGEEFTFILPGTQTLQAVVVAERLRKTLEESPLEVDGETIQLTASFGVDMHSSGQDLSVQAFLQRADECLLQAKSEGRNCVFAAKREEKAIEIDDGPVDSR